VSYLLRVELPDVPGSLGRLASAIGAAGGNIDAIEIVARQDGQAVDDVFLAADAGVMPDSIVSAVQQIEGMHVLWISRYAAGTNLFLDLEAVETMTEDPSHAALLLVDLLPTVFRVDWGLLVRQGADRIAVVKGTSAAPTEIPPDIAWPDDVNGATQFETGGLLVAGTPLPPDEAIVIARRGGPKFLDSELARLDHLVALATAIRARARSSLVE
jgi:hypothetical protein